MEIASLVISILSIVISAIVAGIPFYRKYIEKKTKIALIACDGIIRDDMIRIVVTYVNKNWQNAVIINSHINLYHPKLLNEFTKVNHAYSCKSFNPVVITEKMHASIELEYSLSELKEVDLENADVYVHTEYIDSQGQRLFDITSCSRPFSHLAILPSEPKLEYRVGESILVSFFLNEITFCQHTLVACDGLGASQFILAYHGGRVEAVLTVGNST